MHEYSEWVGLIDVVEFGPTPAKRWTGAGQTLTQDGMNIVNE